MANRESFSRFLFLANETADERLIPSDPQHPFNEKDTSMKCPIDNNDLVMSDRQGIEIDYCPKCRGVWLDRGELDKIIERSAAAPGGPQPDEPVRRYDDGRHHEDDRYRDDRQAYGRPHKKRKSFLGEIFDFD
jgi:Zn-finger nucleic acid-binding protein